MTHISTSAHALATILAVGLLAGCADAPPTRTAAHPTAHETVGPVPQLAGAWYQVQFDSNKFDIDPRGSVIVNTAASVATGNTATHVTVIGRTDRVGSAAANLALSQKRADQVRDALIAAGVPADRIDTRWTGESKQEVPTGNDVEEARNRVVDITVVLDAK